MIRLIVFLVSVAVLSGQAWVDQLPQPLVTYWVTPFGHGDLSGSDRNNTMPLATADANYIAGDFYWILGGDYGSAISLDQDATEANPAVFRCERGARCIIDEVVVNGAHVWIWGWDFEGDPTLPLQTNSALSALGAPTPGFHAINNVSHSVPANCYGAWDTGSGHVFYGNIGYDCDPTQSGEDLSTGFAHCFYGQNCSSSSGGDCTVDSGTRYIVSNMCVDAAAQVASDPFNFHFHGKAQQDTHMENNILINGRNKIGGQSNGQDFGNVVKENWMFAASAFHTGSDPTQIDINNNYFAGRSNLQIGQLWEQDTGEGNPTKPGENNVSNNTFVNDGLLLAFNIVAYCHDDGVEQPTNPNGCDFAAGTTWDNNTFHTTNTVVDIQYSNVDEPSGKLGSIQLSGGWLDDTPYDASSTITTSGGTPADLIAYDPNEYEEGHRCHIFVANWSLSANKELDLSSCNIANGTRYLIHHVNNTNGRGVHYGAVAGGTYTTGTVTTPTNSQQMVAYLVVRDYNFGGGPVANKRSRGRR